MKMMNDLLFKEIMERLFDVIGLEFKEETVKEEDWYLKHSWTKKQEEEFIAWLTKLLVKKKRLNKTIAQKNARFFVFSYGWKRSDVNESNS